MRFELEQSQVADKVYSAQVKKLEKYKAHLNAVAQDESYKKAECSLRLPFDESILSQVYDITGEIGVNGLKYIFVIGIGGSNLGTKAVYDALTGFFDIYEQDRFPKILFVDTNNTRTLDEICRFLKTQVRAPEEVLLNLISKSGGTTETIANAEILIDTLFDSFGDRGVVLKRLVVTTDEGSPLWEEAERVGIHHLPIPKKVGGRYSVFSGVGLFPLHAAGFDVEGLRLGAQHAVQHAMNDALDSDDAMRSAITLYEHYKDGYVIHDTFLFNQEMESVGKWYRQLMGESIGKEKDKDKKKVCVGITPTVSIGSTDLHSMAQLYIGGPKDKVTTFVSADTSVSQNIPKERIFPALVEMIKDESSREILKAILEGVQKVYKKNKLPFMEIVLRDVNEYEIGTLLQFKMLEMMYLAELLNVNGFDQPSVEQYKKETKKILEG